MLALIANAGHITPIDLTIKEFGAFFLIKEYFLSSHF
jgi:hypothetical protein